MDLFYNSPRVALRILFLFVLLVNLVRVTYNYDSCSALLQNGRWRGEKWDPYGCMPFEYGQTTIDTCFKIRNKELVFAGDERSFSAFQASALLLNPDYDTDSHKVEEDATIFIEGEAGAALKWISEQYLTKDSKFGKTVAKWEKMNKQNNVGLVVHSNGLAEVALGQRDGGTYLSYLEQMIKGLDSLGKKGHTKVLILPAGPTRQTVLQDSLTQETVIYPLSAPYENITDVTMEAHERMLAQLLDTYKNVRLVTAVNAMVEGKRTDHNSGSPFAENGVDYITEVNKEIANIVLNVYCNEFVVSDMMRRTTTCCVPETPLTSQQKILGAFFVIVSLLYAFMWFRGHDVVMVSDPESGPEQKPTQTMVGVLLSNLTMLGNVLLFVYICDRTSLLLKERKWYSDVAFGVPVGLCAVLAIYTKMNANTPTFLNRDQTNEWKGWMQLVFLIYHYTGASAVLPIYVLVRVFVAAYVWLSGYGHFFYFYKKNEFGLNRVAQILFRINFLPFWLVLAMDKPYNFYYFCPLITFWFLFVYMSMLILHQHNADHIFMMKKFVAIFAFVIGFWYNCLPGDRSLFDIMFEYPSPLFYLVQEGGSIREWMFRSSLDKYAVPCGMLTAYIYIKLSKCGLINDKTTTSSLFSNSKITIASSIAAFIALGMYGRFARSCSVKAECNYYHTVASPFIILSFVVLRNIYGPFRALVSNFLCFIGKISLELFLLQCHVWLGKDTKGILAIVPGAPILSFAISSLLFLYVSIIMHDITGAMAGIILPGSCTGTALYIRVGFFAALCIGLYLL
eukprot:CFRG4379T1